MRRHYARILVSIVALLCLASQVTAETDVPTPVRIVTDQTTYNAGSVVRLRVVRTGEKAWPTPVDLFGNLRYAGETKPVLRRQLGASFAISSAKRSTEYQAFWKIPGDARTGRYEIDLEAFDRGSHQPAFKSESAAASFAVHRKLVRIERIDLDKTFYTSGDPVAAVVTLRNTSGHALSGLRVEFSNRYWPWIAGPEEAARASVVTLAKDLSLPAGGTKELRAPKAEVADDVKQPATHQYGVVVWDRARKTVLDITFSPLAFFHPPGVTGPRPFPNQYVYPSLDAVNTSGYRQFYPAGLRSPAIQFNHRHTMFAAGGEVGAEFSVTNPTRGTWKGISIRDRVVGPDGVELTQETALGPFDLAPGASSAKVEPHFSTPAGASGLYRVEATVTGAAGDVLAEETLELGVNPLPKSILIFCAHEDDEGGYAGLARAAIENHLPIHYVYFTSGDAGSCDVYYQHSCGPADALNFGGLRMDEVRASLGHLGIAREDVLFIGLPDGGSGEIWYDHVNPRNPFLDPLLSTDHAPYEGLVEPNLPYARDTVVAAIEGLVRKYQPEVIATPHPGNVTHIDHIVNNYFVVKALEALEREGALPSKLTLLVDPVHDPKTQPKTPYRYQDVTFHVSGDAAALAQEAWWFYQSQGGNRAEGHVVPFDKLPRAEQFRQVLDWKEHEGWNEKRDRQVTEASRPR